MSSADEHLATRNAAGLFDFSFMGLYEFPDLASLQPHQTRPLEALAPGQLAYTLVLNADGSVFNDATVWRLPSGRCWLFTGRRGDFVRFSHHARDRSGEYAILALQGPASGRILARRFGREVVLGLRYFRFLEREEAIVARLGYSGELGYELLVPASAASGLRQEILEHDEVRECGWEAANSLRIEAGYVLFDREIDGRANPRELGLERLAPGRDFDLARTLVGLEFIDETARLPEAAVTSECFSPLLGKRIALGFTAPDTKPGDRVRTLDGRTARVAALPFYDPERRRPRQSPI